MRARSTTLDNISVLRQIVSFGAGEGVARGFNWGTMLLLPLFLSSTEEYGRVGLLVSIEMLVSNISLMGLDRAVLRFYAKGESPGTLLRSVLTLWAILAWVPLAIFLVLYLSGSQTLFGIPVAPHLLLLSVIVAISNLNLLCISSARAKRQLAIFLRFRLCYVSLKFVCVLLMATLLGHSLSYVVGIGMSALAMLFFIIPFLRARAGARADRVVIAQLLIFGSPFVFHTISGNVLNYFSRFFLEVYNTTANVGIFTFAFTLGSSLYLAYAALGTYFEPRIYSHADDTPRCERWLALYTNACITLSSIGGASVLLLYPYFAQYLHPDYRGALPAISMVMGTVLLAPLYLQGNYRLTTHTRTWYIAVSSLLGACLSITLNYLLIPSQGIWGAAIAMYVATLFLCANVLFASRRVAGVPLFEKYSLLASIICTCGSLSVLVWAQTPRRAAVALVTVCLASVGILVRSALTLGNEPGNGK